MCLMCGEFLKLISVQTTGEDTSLSLPRRIIRRPECSDQTKNEAKQTRKHNENTAATRPNIAPTYGTKVCNPKVLRFEGGLLTKQCATKEVAPTQKPMHTCTGGACRMQISLAIPPRAERAASHHDSERCRRSVTVRRAHELSCRQHAP